MYYYVIVIFRGIYRLGRQIHNVTEVEIIGKAVFARITDLKYIEQIGKTYLLREIFQTHYR